jgi:hypothetical protein
VVADGCSHRAGRDAILNAAQIAEEQRSAWYPDAQRLAISGNNLNSHTQQVAGLYGWIDAVAVGQ